jgi:hypothetical protein
LVRETAFNFRILYTNVPSIVLRLLAIELMLQEKIWAQGTGMSLRWGAGRGLAHRGLMCRRRLWTPAPLSIGAPLGNLEGGSYAGDVER